MKKKLNSQSWNCDLPPSSIFKEKWENDEWRHEVKIRESAFCNTLLPAAPGEYIWKYRAAQIRWKLPIFCFTHSSRNARNPRCLSTLGLWRTSSSFQQCFALPHPYKTHSPHFSIKIYCTCVFTRAYAALWFWVYYMFGCKVCAVCNRPSCRAGAQHIGCAQRTCSEKIETVQDVLRRSLPCKHKYNTFKYEKQKQQKTHKPRLSSRISSVCSPVPNCPRSYTQWAASLLKHSAYIWLWRNEREKKDNIPFIIINLLEEH